MNETHNSSRIVLRGLRLTISNKTMVMVLRTVRVLEGK